MLNKIQEFLDYTTPVTYSANAKADTSYLRHFTLDFFTSFDGLNRVLTILARGYLFRDGEPDIIQAKRALLAWSSMAFSNTFQDLYGMKQLPGLASQHLMAQGYGYGGEGDWKVAAMTTIMKAMGEGGNGASAFMEDYTYHLEAGNEYSLGAHMLEVCPSLAADKPRIEVHPLGIGDREAPARLVFEGKAGDAIVVSLVDMGGRLRLIVQDIHCVKPIMPMPNLPVARVMWVAEPSLTKGLECWITAGGAHHAVLSYDVSAKQMRDWARMMDIEFVHITKDTTVASLEQELFLNDLAWKLK